MRLHFSLRTLFLLMTAVAGLCLWFTLPSLIAKRFLAVVANEEYQSADAFFRNADDRFLANWSDKRWAFRSSAQLLPLTFDQFVRRQRAVRIETTFMQFDQSLKCDVLITATPLGLKNPIFSATERLGIIYDGRGSESSDR